jgi:hypothetical protein
MEETSLFYLKKVVDLFDQPITTAMIDDRKYSDLVKNLLKRHVSLGKLTPDFRMWPTLADPVDDLRPLDLHRSLNVEDFFVKSAALAASLRALSIESSSLAVRVSELRLEVEELQRQTIPMPITKS